MARLVITIPSQTISFDLSDENAEYLRAAWEDDEDEYGFTDAADVWISDMHSAFDYDVEFVDE